MVRGTRSCPRAAAGCSPRSPGDAGGGGRAGANAVAATAGAPHRIVTDVAEQLALWRIREDGAGLAARSLTPARAGRVGGRRGAARPARRLPARLRRAARASTALAASPTATSATAACTSGSTSSSRTGRARAATGEFVEDGRRPGGVVRRLACRASTATAGRARELLPRMYSPAGARADGRGQARPRPRNLLNPGVLVDPAPLDADLRLAGPPRPVAADAAR